jgi:hypothetical protein
MPWIKYVIPTAPTQHVTLLGGNITTSWFDITELNGKNALYDTEGLECSTAYISSLIEVLMCLRVCCMWMCMSAYVYKALNAALRMSVR